MLTILKKYKSIFLFAIGLLSLLSFSAHAQSVNALFHQAKDPIGGNPNGDVTVVEFFDYQCSHCMDMAPTISAIISKNPNVRVVFKEFPIRGPISEFAARAALAANLQGKYLVFHQALLTTEKILTDDVVLQIASDNGLNVDQLKKDMSSPAIKNQLAENLKLANNLNLNGTPAFFIGRTDAKINREVNFEMGAMTQSELQDLINKAKSS